MSHRPPSPPRPNKAQDLVRRAKLTWRYHGPREVAVRAATFPLRATPLGAKLGHGRRYGSQEAAARRWYRENWIPVTIVIPTYGDPSLVEACVASLRETTDRRKARIVVVDDGSPDPAHRERLRTLKANVIQLEENVGFARACNAGIETAPAGHDVVVLNSDTIAAPRWLERLQFQACREERTAIAGPKLLYPDGRIQSAGSMRNPGAPEWFDHRYRFKDQNHLEANLPLKALGMTGAALYIRRDFLDEHGAFDPAYGMAYEDMDLCLRAWEAGRQVVYAPRSTLLHLESVTRPKEPGPRELASQAHFWEQWGDWFDARNVRTPDGRLRIVYVTEDTGVGGGHRDIFEHVNRLHERGHDVAVWSLAGQPEWFDLQVPVRQFKHYEALRRELEPLEAIKVATWWNTGHTVWLSSVRRGIPVFYVQDVETSYYPGDDDMEAQVLASYREEFRYMTISGYNAENLRRIGREAVLHPPGLDISTFRPLPGVERRDDMLLALGRTNPLKNFPLTIDAWERLGRKPMLTLFGIEPELGPKHGAEYVTKPSDEGVNELFNQCTVFVQTSIHEGFCLPPLEAMATGAAVVCTDAHGNRDFCVDGVNCLIPDPTPESVAGAIQRLLDDPPLRTKLGEAGLRVAQEYAWDARIDELEAYYETLAAGAQRVRV